MSDLYRLGDMSGSGDQDALDWLVDGEALVPVEPDDTRWACPNNGTYPEHPDVCSCDSTTCDENGHWVAIVRLDDES